MAGHSHSANIAVRKGAQDKARGKLFTKLAKEIAIAAKLGGPDPDMNPRLRLAIQKARSRSVPKDTIERAIKRGAGLTDGESYEELLMEGYGPAGVAILCEVLTDNRNRAASEIRHAFSKGGGNLGTSGCVGYLFQRKGIIFVESKDEDAVMTVALEAGAEDISEEDDGFEVVTTTEDFEAVSKAFAESGLPVTTSEIMWVPDSRVDVSSEDAQKLLRLIERLNDCDDVQNVHHNANISDEDVRAFAES